MHNTPNMPPRLALKGISKSFGNITVLQDIDFTLAAGEIHGLAGENGAGKSTLMKIIAGVHADYDGCLEVDGKPRHFRSSADALAAGIGMVHQELCVVPHLTVAENVFLGRQPLKHGLIDWPFMRTEARRQLLELGLNIDPDTIIGSLPVGVQQLVELTRVIFSGAHIIILDEPTSALSSPEIMRLFEVLRSLKNKGKSIIFISHFLDDILAACDSVTVFRNGKKVGNSPSRAIDKKWIIGCMIGTGREALEESYNGPVALRDTRNAPTVATIKNLSGQQDFQDISLEVRAGEIVGVFGFLGCGQVALAKTLAGKLAATHGVIEIDGKHCRIGNTTDAVNAGIGFVPDSRRAMLFPKEPLYKNISISLLKKLSPLWLKPQREKTMAADYIKRLGVRPPNPMALLGTLSGGNQQKVALARWLAFGPKLLILSEPTKGMDVGAKTDVIQIIKDLRERGAAILIMSTEPETILSMADRILVMRKGRFVHEFSHETITKEQLLSAA